MKTRFFTNKKILLAGVFVLAAVIVAILFVSSKMSAQAAFSGQTLNGANLHTTTLASSVSSDTPTITGTFVW